MVEAASGGIFVTPSDAVALAAAVEQLSTDWQRAAAMGRSPRVYVEQHFERADQASHFVALIEALEEQVKS